VGNATTIAAEMKVAARQKRQPQHCAREQSFVFAAFGSGHIAPPPLWLSS
jgi:hypothetical protein